jgi:hypothetical protein
MSMTTSDHPLDPKNIFELFRDAGGHWCARRLDGLVFGMFVERREALRFCRREQQRQFSTEAG